MKRLMFGMCVAAAMITVGCNGVTESPTAPTGSRTVSGEWSGSGTSRNNTSFTAHLTLQQNGPSLLGTWSMMSEYGGGLVGIATSDANGDAINVTLKPRIPGGCGFSLTLMRIEPKRLTGQYATNDCTVPENGAISLSRK